MIDFPCKDSGKFKKGEKISFLSFINTYFVKSDSYEKYPIVYSSKLSKRYPVTWERGRLLENITLENSLILTKYIQTLLTLYEANLKSNKGTMKLNLSLLCMNPH